MNNNLQITEHSRKYILQTLIELSMIVAAIPKSFLDESSIKGQEAALYNAQEVSRMLEGIVPKQPTNEVEDQWQDQESDVHQTR